jgi:hypothetical protein
MKKVFIASRFGEFKEIRDKLTKELKEIGLFPINLDDNKAIPMSPTERSLLKIEEADIVIFLLGDTYGSEDKKSITHLEYEKAIELNKKIYIYGIGKLYENNEVKFSKNKNYRKWQEKIMKEKTFGIFNKDENIDLIVQQIINNVYDFENKVWFDEETGLMWEASIDSNEEHGRLPWYDIFDYKDKRNLDNFGGFNDWRIPTIEELETLLTEKPYPNILYSAQKETFIKKPLLRSMRMKHARFWTKTENSKNKDLAYGIHFGRKREDSLSKNGNKEKHKVRFVRCVRLWRYSEIEPEWEKVKNSNSIEELEKFKKRFPNSSYNDEIDNKIQNLKEKYKAYIESLPLYERKKIKFQKQNNSYSNGLFLKAIEEGFFNGCEKEALLELKQNMEKSKDWKELSAKIKMPKNAAKKKKYENTIKIKNLLEKYK